MSLSKIMIVIDPTRDQQPAFERAVQSAHMTGASLHIYLCVDAQTGYADAESAREAYGQFVDDLASLALEQGVDNRVEVEWAENWRDQTAVAAARCSASMVFKDSIDHRDVQRELRQTSDWTLLRHSPCPVLMVKGFHDWSHRRILAAVNLQSVDSAHARLNNQIVSFAQQFTDAYGSDAHFVTAFADRNHIPSLEHLAMVCGVPLEHAHVGEGMAAEVIAETAEELDADLVIVGTVARDGLKGAVIGNTSERLLDHTRADILVLN